MKTEIPVDAPGDGVVLEIRAVAGARVAVGDVLVVLGVD
jgi:biotin carboxyl carrier protein